MNWRSFFKFALPIIIQFFNSLNESEECPDGVCRETLAELKSIEAELDHPKLKAVDLDFLKCLDFKRFFAAVNEIIAVVRDAMNGVCPDDENNVG